MSSIVVAGDTSGTITLSAPATSGSSVLTLPVATDTLVGKATTDTLTNKTLTSPVIATIVNTGTLTLPTSTDTLVGKATTDTLTNKTLTAPVIATIVNTGTLTLPTSTDTLVGKATTDTLTNKSIVATQLTGTIDSARLPAGSVLQVVSTTKTDTFSSSSATAVDVTGLSVSITPSSASNKILVTGSVCASIPATNWLVAFLLVRNSTSICIADAAGSRSRWTFGGQGLSGGDATPWYPINFLDSPSTTSATTYKIQVYTETPTVYINRGNETDGDTYVTGRFTSTITVMEIKG